MGGRSTAGSRPSHPAIVAALAAIVFVLLSVVPASAATSPVLPLATNELIVRVHPGVSDAPYADVRRGLEETRTIAGSPYRVLTYRDPTSAAVALRALRADPRVASADPNARRYLDWVPGDPAVADQSWWLEQIKAPTAWDMTTGSESIVVAVVDSGVSPTHPDLVNRLVPGYNAVDGSSDTSDIDGHGTHVAGIIAAQGDNGVGTAGVAMDVRIMPIRVVNEVGEIEVDVEVAGIIWAVDNGADVINLSLGSSEYVTAERDAVRYAYDHGVVVVASSGNLVSKYSYPANYEETIAVGSLTATGTPSSFTSRVTRVDLAAPGESIFSPGWDSFYGDYWDDVFYSDVGSNAPISGTSFATAIVSGAAALIRSVAPELGVEQVRSILTGTAVDSGAPGLEAGTGAGQLDAEAAVRAAVYTAMHDTWYATDSPVASGAVARSWLWGQEPVSWAYEPYTDAQHGVRLVYYFDKSRMEVTDPLEDRSSQWYVTNGLLVTEMITGRMQLGDNRFQARGSANINVAGDPDDSTGPTYASFRQHLAMPAGTQGTAIILTIDRDGKVGADSSLAAYGVTGAEYVPETRHRVASVFWDYLNSTGIVAEGDTFIEGPLFDPWFYATGYPVTEAFWARVKLRGQVRDVLVQCFERRCLTYAPDNDPGWEVEMGNVGQHYYNWRYNGAVTDVTGVGPDADATPASSTPVRPLHRKHLARAY